MNLSLRIRLHVLLTIQLIYYPDKFLKNVFFGVFFTLPPRKLRDFQWVMQK